MTSESPFSPNFDRSAFLETRGSGEALRRLEIGLGDREPFLLLTGESGTGKTTLAREAIARWESRVTAAFLAYPTLTAKELLEEIVLRFGGEPPDAASRPRLMACLESALRDIASRGQVAMIVVDDAHRTPAESLEELRLLVNAVHPSRLPLEVLLVGAPALEAMLETSDHAALRDRLSVRVRLEPLTTGEARRYLRHRVAALGHGAATLFPRKLCNEIAALTGGVPRRINALAGEALRLARVAGAVTIGEEHLRAARRVLAGESSPVAEDTDGVEDAIDAGSDPPPEPARGKATIAASRSPAPRTSIAQRGQPETRSGRIDAPGRAARSSPDADDPRPVVPASHDPHEWVSRFVGDQGPIRIGSQMPAASGAESEPEESRRPALGEADPAAFPLARAARPSPGRSRARPSSGPRVLTYALASLAMLSVLALLARSGLRSVPRETGIAVKAAPVASRGALVAASISSAASGISRARKPADRDSGQSSRVPVPNPRSRYTIEVGEVADLEAAFDERDRIHLLTGMDTWVVRAADDLGSHRIIVGIYRSPERAEGAARMLLDSRTLDAATVVPLPAKSERQ